MAGSNVGDNWKYISVLNCMAGMIFTENEMDQFRFVSLLLWYVDAFNDSNLNLFVSIPRSTLKDKFENRYKTIINALVEKDYIEVNNKYSKDCFSKSYRIAERFRREERVFIDKKKRQISKYRDKSVLTNDCQRYVHRWLKELVVSKDPEKIRTETPIRRKLGIDALQHISVGDVNLRKGEKSNRFFHAFLSMPKEYRECCTLNGLKLVSVDIKSAHPTFCYSFYKHIPNSKEESEKYSDILINHDIYNFLRDEIDRDIAKEQMSRFLSSEKILKSTIAKNFKKEFPLLYGYIIKQDGLCLYLQNLEAELVCNRLVSRCNEFGYPIITEHDGFRALECQVDTIREWLRQIIKDECGINAVLKRD